MQSRTLPSGETVEPCHTCDNRSRLSVLAEKLPRGTKIDLDRLLEAELANQGLGDQLRAFGCPVRLMALAPCWAGSLCIGTALGYSLPASRGLDMARHEGTLDISRRQIFWFGSLMTLGAVFGSLGGALLTQRCGRRWSLAIAALGLLASWMAFFWARYLYEFLVVRFVTGLFTGLVSLVVPAHIAEMAVVSDRGADGAVHQLAIILGILYACVVGRFLDLDWLAAYCALPAALLLLPASWLLVESPRWLLQKGDSERAREALISVRSAQSQAEVEFDAIQAVFPRYRTPVEHYFLALLVMTTQQLSGINSIMISTTSIESGPEFSMASIDSIIMLVVLKATSIGGYLRASDCHVVMFSVVILEAVATAGAVPFVDIAGRRRVLGVSVLVCSVSLASLAAIYYFSEEKPLASDDEVTSMTTADKTTEVSTASARELDNAVTFLLKAIFVAGFSSGLGPLPWILGAELTPLRGTGLEFGTVCAANWAGSFVTANFFATTGTTKALAMSLFLYSGITLTCGLLIVANLPETMNMSIEEILMHTNGEQAVKRKKKKTREARGAPAQEQLAIKREGAASTSVPPPPIEQGLPADGQTVSNAPEKQIAAEVEPQPQCSGTRSPSIASRRSMASKASRASRQSERADMKDYQ